ncbi:MAG: fused MFS/spermidine synthase [Chloroflexi bacterium]|nr:fused MFS/spermidine synthase [Chloroflexota bacterium]
MVWRTGLIVFLANCAILILQLCAGRLLSPFIGVSLATWTAVIGVFMLGISLGNWFGGRIADRAPTTRTLGLLLVLGSLASAGTLGLIGLLGDGAVLRGLALYPRIALLTLLLCFPPSFVLSMITPVAIRIMLPDVGHAGRVVGLIYALGTLGSLAGNFLTGFVLIATFPINAIVLGVAGLLLGLGLLVVALAPPAAAVAVSDASTAIRSDTHGTTRTAMLPVIAACAVVAVSSFCTMLIELAASRVLAPYVGVSLYSWTGIIGVVLAGIATGNVIGGRLADHAPRRSILGVSLVLGGLASLAILPLIEFVTPRQVLGSLGLMERIVALSLLLFFVPVLLLGTISPQAIRLAIADVAHAGRTAGRIYAWSTAGAIAGAFAAGWVLISLLGVRQLIFLAGVGLLALGIVAGALWRRWPLLVAAGGVGIAAIVTLAATGQLASRCTQETDYFCIRTYFNPDKDGGVMVLVQDHLVHSYVQPNNPAYMGYDHEHVQVDLSLAAAARAGDQPNILLIGGGGYTYPRWVEAFLPRASIEVVEIDPGVTETAYRDLGLRRDTRIQTHNMDGRQFVQEQASPGHYDLIVQDAVNDLSVPGHIMTKEYNDRIRGLLTDDGVYLLSVIDLYRDGQLLRSAIRTMQQTFPHVQLLATSPSWTSGGANVFVVYGANRPLDLDEVGRATRAHGQAPRLVAQPLDELAAYVADGPQIILTDQYAPVDNLISILFSRRNA